jgi:hypothetical protein
MAPSPWPSTISSPTAPERFMYHFSSTSFCLSQMSGTVTVFHD